MPRFSMKQYQSRVVIAMAIYAVVLVLAWPVLQTATSVGLKALLAILPTLPVIYVIGQLVRLIRDSDEMERHTHLVALSVATAVVSALSLIGGFLSMARVVKLDGSILIFVFPAIALCYGLTRWWVLRQYGGSVWCEQEVSVKQYLYLILIGVLVIVAAAFLPPWLSEYRRGFIYGAGAGFIIPGLLLAVIHQYRRKFRND